MSKTTKAVLLSALVFPGSGHLYLRKYIPGLVLFLCSLLAAYFVFSSAWTEALEIVDKIDINDAMTNPNALADYVAAESSAATTSSWSFSEIVFLVSWVIGIIDTYRLGRIQGEIDAGSSTDDMA